jgi:hypothetical protein
MFCDKNGTIYAHGELSGSNSLFVYKDNVWKYYKLPFFQGEIKIDKATDSLYLLPAATGDAGIYRYRGTGSFADSASYSFIDIGAGFAISDFDIFNSNLTVAIVPATLPAIYTDSNQYGIIYQPLNGKRTLIYYPGTTLLHQFTGMASVNGSGLVMQAKTDWWVSFGAFTEPDLYYFKGNNWSIVPVPPVPTYSPAIGTGVSLLKYSRDETLWFINNFSGLGKYANQSFSFYDLGIAKVLSNATITDFAIDNDNVKWIVCDLGLIEYKANN